MTTWYRDGLVTLTVGSNLVAGVGSEWVDSVLPGGIFFTPTGLYEVERVISDTSLKLVSAYAGATVAGAEYAIAPTQGYLTDLAKQLGLVLGTFGELKDAWEAGDLIGRGLAIKGVKDTVADLPATATPGDVWLVDSAAYVWTGLVWRNAGQLVTTPELEAVRDAAIAAKDASEAIAASFGDVDAAIAGAAAQAGAALGQAEIAVERAAAAAVSATNAAASLAGASAARDAAIIGAGVFVTEAAGRAAAANGAAFKVQGDADVAAYEYRRVDAGSSVLIATYPSAAAVSAIREVVNADESTNPDLFKIIDADGNVGVRIAPDDSFKTRSTEFGHALIETDLLSLQPTTTPGFVVVDADGFIGTSTEIEGPGAVSAAIAARSASNLVATINAWRPSNLRIQRPTGKLNLWLTYGQSFSIGAQSSAVLSTTPRFGNKMLGGSPRGGDMSATSTAFAPIGGNVLMDLVEVAQDVSGAIVPAGNTYYGETVLSGLLNNLKRIHNDRVGKPDDTDHVFAGACTGVGGKTIAQLTKGATPNLYNRYLTALSGFMAAAVTAGHAPTDVVVCGIVWMQGENDASAAYATHLAALRQIGADTVADAMAATGQARPPAFYIYQMGGAYTSDVSNLGVQMAQLEFVRTTPGAFFVGPVAPYPDPGAHLAANSFRWYGAQLAKVAGQTLKGASPVRFAMRSASFSGTTAMVDFSVPVPPLKFGTPYDATVAQDYVDKGFVIKDAIGTLSGADVVPRIAADTVIQLTCSRVLSAPVTIWLGDKTVHNGHHCVMDSDPDVSDELWEYGTAAGQNALENIPALLNKPYPLSNWCAAGTVLATAT